MNIDLEKAHITLADGTVWQVLDADGNFDDAATAAAIRAHMESQTNAGNLVH